MANPQKRRGDASEREVAAILSDQLGLNAKRALGAGRREDTGDIFGLPDTVIQCAAYKDLARAVNEKLPALERQMVNAGATHGAVFLRRRGGAYIVVTTPEVWCRLWRDANPGVERKAA